MKKLFAAAMAGLLCATAAWAAAQDFTLVNGTGKTVMTINISPTGEDEWGPDLLGANVMEDGQSASVSFDVEEGRCLWDVRATYDDGDTGDWRGLDLCEISTITLN